MMPTSLTERVRLWICQQLAQVSSSDEPPLEALLIRDGYFCGRRYALEDHQAVWFIEEDQIKLFGPEGQVLKSLIASELAAEDLATVEPVAERVAEPAADPVAEPVAEPAPEPVMKKAA